MRKVQYEFIKHQSLQEFYIQEQKRLNNNANKFKKSFELGISSAQKALSYCSFSNTHNTQFIRRGNIEVDIEKFLENIDAYTIEELLDVFAYIDDSRHDEFAQMLWYSYESKNDELQKKIQFHNNMLRALSKLAGRCFIRNVKYFYRRIVRFLFKNMDDNSGNADAMLLTNKVSIMVSLQNNYQQNDFEKTTNSYT